MLRVKMNKLSAAPEIEMRKINHKNVQNQLQTPLISDSIQTMDTSVSFPKLEVIFLLLRNNNYVIFQIMDMKIRSLMSLIIQMSSS